jgi:hypothetical protein
MLEIIDEIRPRKDERSFLRKVIAALGAVCLVVLLAVAVTWPTKAHAGPILKAEAEGIVVTIYEEACQLKEVTNLPKRATWTEKGKTFEGCIGAHPQFPVLMGYFSDKTVVVLPVEMFTRVVGA